MKKTLIASAVAAATFSGAALADAHMPTVYGNIQYALAYSDVKGGESGLEHFDNGTTIGLSHEHEIAPGVTGFYKLELERIGADDKAGSNGVAGLDEAYIGAQGDFGKVWVGSDDSTYERAAVLIGNFHEVGSNIFTLGDTGEGDLIQYETPSFGGLTVGAAVQVNGENDAKGGTDKSFPYQLAATYSVDALTVAFAMDSNDGGQSDNNENTYGLTGTFNAGNLSIIGEYQTRKDVADIYGIMGVYGLGANQFALSYQVQDNEAGDELDTVILQALHNVSDHMYVYAEGYLLGGDDGSFGVADESEASVAAVGAVYYF
ncbi:porin [Marinobacter sp. F4216]|uniref:porin n=1 Tax=Marinobacter sp. F4216 TaxID=2874281 RepID=UPI001CBBD637|nr:porin [Marinobacter sp. F4216]MBZ2170183.1 porin [Marinobacter sp. F4216]